MGRWPAYALTGRKAAVRRRSARPLVSAGARGGLALFTFVVAFAVRAYWAIRVQSPLTAVYSDMGGYVSRAEALLAGTTPSDPRILLMWPWGTHVIVAAELAVFGKTSPVAIALVHAFGGAIAAPLTALLTARFTRSKLAVAISGLAVALWHPHIVYSGFFSSEIWFTSAILLFSLFLVRHYEGRGRTGSALAAGLALAVAFAIRPQILMTCGIIGIVTILGWIDRPFERPRRGIVRFALPLIVPVVLTMAGSILRYHRLDGSYGLIASNEPAQRLFGETSVGKLDSSWTAPDGSPWSWWVSPHTKHPVKPEDVVTFRGFVYDRKILAQFRAERLRGVTPWQRALRMVDNVELLAARNLPWPEDDFRRFKFRHVLQQGFATAFWPILVLAFVGAAYLGKHRLARLVIGAQLGTIVFVAAIYLGEARYRVPYDPFIIILATMGLVGIARAAQEASDWIRARVASRPLADRHRGRRTEVAFSPAGSSDIAGREPAGPRA